VGGRGKERATGEKADSLINAESHNVRTKRMRRSEGREFTRLTRRERDICLGKWPLTDTEGIGGSRIPPF